MNYTFSPGTERALAAAANWQPAGETQPLDLRQVLLGLASETECRAAQILGRHGICLDDIHQHWPELQPASQPVTATATALSASVRQAIRASQRRLEELPQPLPVATEHLLLGMLDLPGEVADWLAAHGLSAEMLEREIFQMYGQSPGPIDVEGIAAAEPYVAEVDAIADLPVGTLRILDAAANRAREAVRVVEDYTRFVLDDRHLTERCKRLRHALAALLKGLPIEALVAARETQQDVGATLSLPSEQWRKTPDDVVVANAKRLQESLRTLEEFGKTITPALGEGFEQLRYQSYTLERAIVITGVNLQRLHDARLYVLIDACATPEEFESLAQSLVSAGVDVLQLRDKRLDDRTLLDRARRLRAITDSSRTLLIVNDRADLAVLSQADGVHVGQEELSVKEARTIVGAGRFVGVSTHSIEQARRAVLDGADYIGVGPTFPSSTKQFAEFTGVELLHAVAAEIRLPAFAIGGITLENLPQVLQTGIRRVAVSGAIARSSDPTAAAGRFLELLKLQLDPP